MLLSLPLRIDEWPLAIIIGRLIFHKVDNIESVDFVFSSVLDTEKVPLTESTCVVVIFKEEVVLCVTNFDSFSQIATFKSAFKNQCLVAFCRWLEFVVRL